MQDNRYDTCEDDFEEQRKKFKEELKDEDEKPTGLGIFQIMNNWESKDFALGVNLATQALGKYLEIYLMLHLTFWQIAIGFKIPIKPNYDEWNELMGGK